MSGALERAGDPFDHGAWICLDNGKIYWRSSATGLDDEDLPEDIDDSDQYLAAPSQHDLDLDHRLALTFGEPTVASRTCSRRVASWYEFETYETDEALLAWCA